jgi:hypothetical protein
MNGVTTISPTSPHIPHRMLPNRLWNQGPAMNPGEVIWIERVTRVKLAIEMY